jgi:hypothetical protein
MQVCKMSYSGACLQCRGASLNPTRVEISPAKPLLIHHSQILHTHNLMSEVYVRNIRVLWQVYVMISFRLDFSRHPNLAKLV